MRRFSRPWPRAGPSLPKAHMASLTLPLTKIRVLCVDDSPDLAEMLARCINAEFDMESVGCLHSADNLAGEVERSHADVVLLDMTMPGKDPVAALADLALFVAYGRDPKVPASLVARVIAYSGYT